MGAVQHQFGGQGAAALAAPGPRGPCCTHQVVGGKPPGWQGCPPCPSGQPSKATGTKSCKLFTLRPFQCLPGARKGCPGALFFLAGPGHTQPGLVLGHSKPPRWHLWLDWGPFPRRAAVPPRSGSPAHPEKKFNWPQSGGCPAPQMGATTASWAGLPGKGKAPSRQPTCGSKPGAPHVGSVGAGRK